MSSVIATLYEDKVFFVFDKPSGLLVVPDHRGRSLTLEALVNKQYPDGHHGRLYPCHRLDRETSGAIIFARGKTSQEYVMDQFRKGLVEKKYIAFVRGKMQNPAGEIKSMIRDFHEKKYRRDFRKADSGWSQQKPKGPTVRPNEGKLAVTRYKLLAVKRLFSVVEVCPLTGRTNQIRIHFGEIGHPILGERLYAFGKDFPLKFGRVALHAQEVSFVHPQTAKRIVVRSELAKDMENFLNRY